MLKDGHIRESKFLDLSHLNDLRYIRAGGDGRIHIGARTTYGDCARNPRLRREAGILLDAIRTIGAPPLRNIATVAGNLGNASPAGDAIPPLFVLDAKVILESAFGRREVGIEEFFSGYRKTIREPNELIREVSFLPVHPGEIAFFKKLGLRRANAISIASVALWARVTKGRIRDARIALGAVAPTVIRAKRGEALLKEIPLTTDGISRVAKECAEESKPISDIRGSASYRKEAVEALTYIGLVEATQSLQKRPSR
jgi:CO/xanthine dehydrogenase FAD-binding subunit